jgi:hypothetical protein
MKFHRIKTGLVVFGMALALGGSAYGQSADAILDLLVRKGIITDKEVKEIKEQADADMARMLDRAEKTKVASWIDEMKWSGDLRLRAEFFDNEDQFDPTDRWRYRYRLRLGFETKFKDWATIGVRVSSGGEDPVSTNQSFDDTFSRKEFRIDLAYVTLQPPGWDWVSVSAGKIKNPIWQTSISSPLQYDHDVTPEGVAEQFEFKFGEDNRHKLFANFGQFALDEIGSDANDPYLLEFQGGFETRFGKDPKKPVVKATAAGGYMLTMNADLMSVPRADQPGGTNVSSVAFQSTSPNRGNATRLVNGNRLFFDDFQVVTARGEIVWQLRDQPFLGTPCALTLSGEYIKNLNDAFKNLIDTEVANLTDLDQTEGYTGQVAFGGNKKQGEWQIAYQYKHLEADATWDAITDSDWGLGGTDRKGHVFKGSYNVRDWWQLTLSAFITEKISRRATIASPFGTAHQTRGLAGEELLRIQMDTAFKF